jgi:glutathionylspermidine synthase
MLLRRTIAPRINWQGTVESQGFPFHTAGLRPSGDIQSGTYWAEDAYYEFTSAQVDVLEAATEDLHLRCLDAVEYVCTKRPELLARLGIPEAFHGYVQRSWKRGDPSVYGRFDLAYDGEGAPKLLEYNADTPTTLIETSVIQFHWLEEIFGKFGENADQFNSVHEKLIEWWRHLAPLMNKGTPLYFLAVKDNVEEYATVEYLRDTCVQANLPTRCLYLEDLGHDDGTERFFDLNNNPVDYAFKLYPWEYLFTEDFGKHLLEAENTLGLIEPPWKAILSNKGILPILWEMFPDHPNLLPAYWEQDRRLGDAWISKPIVGREGANMHLQSPSVSMTTDGLYGDEPKIFQKLAKLGKVDGMYVSIGSWVVGGKAAGMCVREDTQPIIVDKSRLVPHIFR